MKFSMCFGSQEFWVSCITVMTVGRKISLHDILFFNWRTYNNHLYIRGIFTK